MKNSRLLNSEISYEIAKIGHTQHLCICDAGLPINKNSKRIDLALEKNIPSFLEVLNCVLSEMCVEEIFLAEEIKIKNKNLLDEIQKIFKDKNVKINFISHEKFKILSTESNAIIRSGECSPYANIILVSGVVF